MNFIFFAETTGILDPMNSRIFMNILTLVLAIFAALTSTLSASRVYANPHTEAPQAKDTKEEEPETPPPPAYTNDFLSVTPVTAPAKDMSEMSRKFSKADYFYPYRQALTPRIGLDFVLRHNDEDEDNDKIMNLMFGFNYLIKKDSSPQWEVGADLSLANQAYINVMRRYIYNERGSFRPYYKYGVMHKTVADQKFASFSNWNNYLAKVGMGFEDIIRPPRSLRLELEAAMGAKDIFIMFTYGYSFGW
jgi:hypothetical protein